VIDDAVAARLADRARECSDAAERALAEARDLRAVMDAVFRPPATAAAAQRPPGAAVRLSAKAAGRPSAAADEPPGRALAHLLARTGAAVERARLARVDGAFHLLWDGDHLERPLWPLAAAAVDLLRSGPLDRLKACEDCPWLFLDTSRNRSRRWCTMDDCGSRSKMRRYRARRATAGR
jgi:hypothetical protein